MQQVTLVNGFPTGDCIPAHFPSDWDAADGAEKKYVYVQDGKSATWSLNPSYPGGILRVAIEAIDGHAGMADEDVKANLEELVFFPKIGISEFLATCLAYGISGASVSTALANDDFVERLTRVLSEGAYQPFAFLVSYSPTTNSMPPSDIAIVFQVIDDRSLRAVDMVASVNGVTAPSTISEADVAAARVFIQ